MTTRIPFKLYYWPVIVLVVLAAATNHRWLLIPAFGYVVVLIPVIAVINNRAINQRERYRRWREMRCVSCGYSLQGNVSGVCPECGKRIPEQPPKRPVGDEEWFPG